MAGYTYKNIITRASLTLQLIEDVAIYKAELFSSAGNIFQPTDKQTDISVKVFKGLQDITEKFKDIKWRRFTFDVDNVVEDLEWGNQHDGKKTITVTKKDVDEKAKFQCEVYDIIDKARTLVAVESITIVDVNDLKPSKTPPENPIDGQIWLDSSVDPPIIKMWNSTTKQWVVVSSADPQVRNLLRNSNFFTKNFNLWDLVGTLDEMRVEYASANTFAIIRQETASAMSKGVSQTIDNAKPKKDYTIQVKANAESLLQGGLLIAVYSIDESGSKTLIKEDVCVLTDTIQLYSMKVKTLDTTKKLEVYFGGERNRPYHIRFTETMIANTSILTPWELAPEDVMDAINGKMNHEDIFNALTDNGKMQGIFTQQDSEGNTNFYFNASYIKTGTLKGELVDAKGLVVHRESDNLKTLEITKEGEININASSISIMGDNVATEDDIAYKIEIISSNGTVFTNGQISTELSAIIYKGKDNITDTLDASKFKWTRISKDPVGDITWNETEGIGVKTVTITREDVFQRATFSCSVET